MTNLTFEFYSVLDKKVVEKLTLPAGAGKRFDSAGIVKIIEQIKSKFEDKNPAVPYRLVPMIGGRYRFICESFHVDSASGGFVGDGGSSQQEETTTPVRMREEIGFKVRWHVEDGDLVIDESNVPVNSDLANMICPPAVAEIMGVKYFRSPE